MIGKNCTQSVFRASRCNKVPVVIISRNVTVYRIFWQSSLQNFRASPPPTEEERGAGGALPSFSRSTRQFGKSTGRLQVLPSLNMQRKCYGHQSSPRYSKDFFCELFSLPDGLLKRSHITVCKKCNDSLFHLTRTKRAKTARALLTMCSIKKRAKSTSGAFRSTG